MIKIYTMKKLTPFILLLLASCGAQTNKSENKNTDTTETYIDVPVTENEVDSTVVSEEDNSISEVQPVVEEEKTVKSTSKTFSLEKTKWKLVEFNGKKIGTQGKETPYIILDPEGSKLNGHSGCNNFNGTYKLDEGLRISFGPIMATKMYCENNMVNESAFLSIFEQVDNYSIYENSLSLSKARMAPFARFKAE